MSKPDKTIDPRIIASAKEEFLDKGFANASLQTICHNANVTTGALYKRYKSKEELFGSIVEPAIEAIFGMINGQTIDDLKVISDEELIDQWCMKEEKINYYFQFLYQYHDEFTLLLCHSAGTKYENYSHDLVAMMSKATILYYKEGFHRKLFTEKISDEEFHVLLSAFWTTIYEPFIHDMSWDEIMTHSKLICKFFDWSTTIGIKN